ncbi:uncharacterized protein MELLADRAFT_90517 [Melampsora larici-populina 98AG31]|uniref:Uncharacterized protein n=1 Tax=Melampsora larici-populina (strain 98AG31 / pathotype 3-4-7) TaxID=747676 RepID=F4RX67_MELLP|nr:uncharacterized protein MELLADRAFT_90517 [Melampsora larici-populina 98AG31]EGG03040.1 hypothetical protein MELLADRAFT_90517 [Melampsora larici-populina 98AG31]
MSSSFLAGVATYSQIVQSVFMTLFDHGYAEFLCTFFLVTISRIPFALLSSTDIKGFQHESILIAAATELWDYAASHWRIPKCCIIIHFISQLVGAFTAIQLLYLCCRWRNPLIFSSQSQKEEDFTSFAQGPAGICATLLDESSSIYIVVGIEAAVGFIIGALQSATSNHENGLRASITFNITFEMGSVLLFNYRSLVFNPVLEVGGQMATRIVWGDMVFHNPWRNTLMISSSFPTQLNPQLGGFLTNIYLQRRRVSRLSEELDNVNSVA